MQMTSNGLLQFLSFRWKWRTSGTRHPGPISELLAQIIHCQLLPYYYVIVHLKCSTTKWILKLANQNNGKIDKKQVKISAFK
jgi:hypothetical protein